MTASVSGTFATGGSASTGTHASPSLLVPRGPTSAKLSTQGCDASNTIKTQKRTVPGGAWADQVTYNSEQTNAAITVAEGEEWQLVSVALQANRQVGYRFTLEA